MFLTTALRFVGDAPLASVPVFIQGLHTHDSGVIGDPAYLDIVSLQHLQAIDKGLLLQQVGLLGTR
jgi:hypothetical protein